MTPTKPCSPLSRSRFASLVAWPSATILTFALILGACGPSGPSGSNGNTRDAGTRGDGGSTRACEDDDDCARSPLQPFCSWNGVCVECVENDFARSCGGALTCCDSECVNLRSSLDHCGDCGDACAPPNATARCSMGVCTIEACLDGFHDCDQEIDNGCEASTAEGGCQCEPGVEEPCYSGPAGTMGVGICRAGLRTCNAAGTGYGPCVGEILPAPDTCLNTLDDDCDGIANNGFEAGGAGCICLPGTTQPCYSGPPGTENVGICHGGLRTCAASGTAWGICEGEQTPQEEVCFSGIDEDCSGVADDVQDIDGDGWTRCDGDCCETTIQCSEPHLVNPGAFEFVGNGVDDDCDPSTPDHQEAPLCSASSSFSVTPTDVAKAMDLCQFTTENPPANQRKWGVISVEFLLPNGSAPNATQLSNMQRWQAAVLANYGTVITPRRGSTMAGISTGRMRDANDPGYVNPNSGTNFGSNSTPPAAYLTAHGGSLPSSAGCSGTCVAGSDANDGINVRMRIRVPTNAFSFSYDFRFFTAEYWTYACTAFNDFYLALLGSTAAGIPADRNISFDAMNNPVSVNNGFFDLCVQKSCYTCPYGSGELAGTGMELNNTGGGTRWLTTTAPVVPGEIITLELMVFDVSDNILDSLSLLDNFAWHVTPSGVGTEPSN